MPETGETQRHAGFSYGLGAALEFRAGTRFCLRACRRASLSTFCPAASMAVSRISFSRIIWSGFRNSMADAEGGAALLRGLAARQHRPVEPACPATVLLK